MQFKALSTQSLGILLLSGILYYCTEQKSVPVLHSIPIMRCESGIAFLRLLKLFDESWRMERTLENKIDATRKWILLSSTFSLFSTITVSSCQVCRVPVYNSLVTQKPFA